MGMGLELWQRRKENCFFLAEQRPTRLFFFFFFKIEWGADSRVLKGRVQGRELCVALVMSWSPHLHSLWILLWVWKQRASTGSLGFN